MRRMALTVACATLMAGAAARGEESDAQPAKLFESLDTNHDGAVAADEVSEERKRFFERLVRLGDKDSDARLTQDEFVAALSIKEEPVADENEAADGPRRFPDPGQMFDRLDRNKDGKLTKDELPEPAKERLQRLFERVGKDELTREDFLRSMERRGDRGGPPGGLGRPDGERMARQDGDRGPDGGPPRDGNRPGDGDRGRGPEGRGPEGRGPDDRGPNDRGPGDRGPGPGGPDGRGSEGRGPMGPGGFRGGPALVRILDEDRNGRISKDELAKAADKFGELDRNDDGQLEPSELMGFPGGFGRGMGPGGDRGFGQGFGPGRGRGGEMARGDGPPRRPEGDRPYGDRPGPDGDRRGPEGDRPHPPAGRGPDGDRPREGDRPRPEFGRGERGRGPEGDRGPEFLMRFDLDHDGAVSKDEAPERMKERFDSLDENEDGKVTAEEFQAVIIRRYGLEDRRRD